MIWFRVLDKFSDDLFQSFFKFEKISTDTTVFRLHYKLSVWLVILYSICYTYVSFKNPISCLASTGGNDAEVLKAVNDFCWVRGTYILTNLDPEHQVYPGIGGVTSSRDEVRYHHYYKWMYFYMFSMIIILLIPRSIWRSIENGRLRLLLGKLDCVLMLGKDETIEREKEMIADYMSSHLGYHRPYALGFIFAELLNVLVSAALMFTWDSITDHEFSLHGSPKLSYLETSPVKRTDRLAQIFPLLGKCTFTSYGPGGNAQPRDYICILPLNIINERAAIFFWYYFMVLVSLGACTLLFRLALMVSKRFRIDWFVLYKMGSNVEPVIFRQILQKFIRKQMRGNEV